LALGGIALAILNRAAAPLPAPMNVTWAQAGVPAGSAVAGATALWPGSPIPYTDEGFVVDALDTHDTMLVRVSFAPRFVI
jgi:hypothetical protein